MQETRIREATGKDLAKVYEIEALSFKDPYPPSFINLLHQWNPKTFLVAEREGRVVGYVVATTNRDAGHVVSIAVNPEERRKKVGRALMNRVLDILKGMRIGSVKLEVRRSNKVAQRFYEAQGFECSYTVSNYYGDEDGLVYFKFLWGKP